MGGGSGGETETEALDLGKECKCPAPPDYIPHPPAALCFRGRSGEQVSKLLGCPREPWVVCGRQCRDNGARGVLRPQERLISTQGLNLLPPHPHPPALTSLGSCPFPRMGERRDDSLSGEQDPLGEEGKS